MNREMTFQQKILLFVGILKKDKCYCMKQFNGEKYYCYRLEHGRWESHKGPFNSKQECQPKPEATSIEEFLQTRGELNY